MYSLRNKKNLYFFQFGFKYGKEVLLPYSVGMLWAHAKTFKEIEENYENKGFIFIREDPDKIVSSLDNPEIAAFSTYLWNWEMSIEVAKRIKKKFPKCFIIFGGHQVPDDTNGFFNKYHFIDILVHAEGEITFSEILKEYLKKKNYNNISGLTFNTKSGNIKSWVRREPIADLDILPSPYLTGVFDEILKLPYNFQPTWETNRGCPYSCVYCDWGSSFSKKIRLFNEDRLDKEVEWFAKKKISLLYGADANFGILPRDIKIAEKLAKTKAETGYPEKFRASFAKNTTEIIFKIAKILNEQKLDKGISLSVQSMDKNTLKIVKRINLKINSLSEFIRDYQREKISTFTELILGLPGETYDSFKRGVNELLNAGFHDSLIIYLCSLLPNAQLNDPGFKKKYKIKTTRGPIFLNHSIPGTDPVQEYDEIVTSTKYLSTEDWKRQCIFGWIVQACHVLNLTQVIAIYFKAVESLEYLDFYEKLLSFAEENPDTIIGQELSFTKNKIEQILAGNGWDIVLEEFSNITWSTDEASYLRISENLDQFFIEIKDFIKKLSQSKILDDLIIYQHAIIVKWNESGDREFELNYPLHHFYKAQLTGKDFELKRGRYKVKIIDDPKFNGDKKRYAKEIVWWGRKGGKFIYQNITENN